MLDGADLFTHGDCSEQSLPFSLGIVFFVNGAPMDVVDDSYGSCGGCGHLGGEILGCFPSCFVVTDVLFQVSNLD